MTAGEKIRKRRLELNMTMDDLGKAIGVQRSAINKYEKDMIDMKASTLAAIARVLMVSPVYLLDDVEDDESDQARLEALHQDPRLGLLFDRTRKMSHADVDFMIQMADRILKERDGDD
jgi:transcriptional regulator with XRE-family HTH domain